MGLTDKHIRSVISLPAAKRYEHFVKQVADSERVWGLSEEGGWAISADEFGTQSLPVWCATEYAMLSKTGEWSSYEPHAVDLDTFLDEMLESLDSNGIQVAVMYLPQDAGVVVSPRRMKEDLEVELEKY